MDETRVLIQKAALLHDIGKICLRAEPGTETHSEAGVNFLKPYFVGDNGILLDAVAYHHGKQLGRFKGKADNIAYIIYEADNIAAATDRRTLDEGSFGFNKKVNLESVFNLLKVRKHTEIKDKTGYCLRGLMKEEKALYPMDISNMQASANLYRDILLDINDNFRKKSPVAMEINELLQILEATMTYVPSSTATSEAADISLYDHEKLTAAFAVAMYDYFKEMKIVNYKEACFGPKAQALRQRDMFILVSGDLSGIQKFIYTIPSKGALKSLRGRSFYLELVVESIVDEIFEQVGLSRANLLYAGGGRFTMLLPRTTKVLQILELCKEYINEWFLQNFGNRLYMALAWTPCSANEFCAEREKGVGELYHRVSRLLSKEKLNRYTKQQLANLFLCTSKYNAVSKDSRECAICHTSAIAADLKPYSSENTDTLACASCRGLMQLGKAVLNHHVFSIELTGGEDTMPLPGFKRTLYVKPMCEDEAEHAVCSIRMYVKNNMWTGKKMATRLWVGDYSIRNSNGQITEFEELAVLAGGDKTAPGIQRLAVMRADVDNLGAAFVAGYSEKYATLTRTAALSRQLSLFFKRYINDICNGDVNGTNGTNHSLFSLFQGNRPEKRKVHIVYSGGDDMFIVGTWDDVIELAVDIRHAFRRFTNNKLTFSAGIGFFKSGIPVSTMARVTGQLENLAKNNSGKDSIALFGASSEVQYQDLGGNEGLSCGIYHWQEFVEEVCGKKIKFLQEHFYFDEKEKDSEKIFIGKSGLYRMMRLMNGGITSPNTIDLARFAYMLARMEPQEREKMPCYVEIRKTLYCWFKSKADRQQVVTAIQLIIYSLRM